MVVALIAECVLHCIWCIGFYDVGGFNELWRRYPLAVTNYTVANTTCHEVSPYWNVMLRGPSDPEMPWPGFLFGQTPASIWYWCSDQVLPAAPPAPTTIHFD